MSLPLTDDKTEVGNYFISNYPPFSFWDDDGLPELQKVLDAPGDAETELGLYLHIPFCRKRCKFCYFRVYTDKNSKEIERYMQAISDEIALYRDVPAVAGRELGFVYFGGGTPSYISPKQLRSLVDRLRESVQWDTAREVTFECEPGTLTESKLEAIREIGCTRLSLGIENFDDDILEENGRAHRSPEAFRAYEWAQGFDFDSVNIDLIAGMVGETEENWRECIKKTIDLAPDSVTIYQMELPFNTVYSKEVTDTASPVADWKTKRRWVEYAFDELGAQGYKVSSAYTLVKNDDVKFVYRDGLWHGADLLGTGVASFGHLGGVHYQNIDGFDNYCQRVEAGEAPLHRAYPTTPRQRLIREMILQLKTGHVDPRYFETKFSVDIIEEFADVFSSHRTNGHVGAVRPDGIELTREGLLRVDSLLEPFFEPEHRAAKRYT